VDVEHGEGCCEEQPGEEGWMAMEGKGTVGVTQGKSSP